MNDVQVPVLDTAPPTGISANDALWYKDAVIYQVNVKSFFDSNDDGIGDFKGLTSKLEYIRDLGVNTIWLMPFYPSPLKDDGYDIADYQNVHPQFGTLDDFRNMLQEAHRLGLKVITELIINHTSDQHPWFQAARHAPAGIAAARFLRVERHGPEISRHAHHLYRHGSRPIGPGTRRRRPTTGIASSVISRI